MKRQTAVVAALVVAVSVLLSAQNQEFARIIRNGDVATLTAFGPRPVDLAAKQLADEFRIAVNVEDPVYMYRDDVQDITTPAASRAGRRLLIPRTAFLEVGFRLRQDDALQDVQQMVHDLADAANGQLPFQYRVDNDDDVFTLVATRSRDVQGRAIELTPLLDHRITIPLGTRTLIAHVQLLVRDLEQQTGFRIGCCQGAVGGVPWGSTVVTFEARAKPARSALRQLIRSEPGHFHWLLRCEPGESWCFINVGRIQDNPSTP